MTRKLCYVLFIIAILLGLTSCGFVEEAKHVDDWLPKVKKDSEIIIYDKCRQKICVYDTKKMEIVSENNTENFF